jgi:peptidyl-prolyl cis-trans isomerase B (cyclophilin B)
MITLSFLLTLVLPLQAPARRPASPAPFKTTLAAAAMTNKQAVIETASGNIVIELRPDLAPNHVGYFIKLASEGAYNGTSFHRVVRGFVVQTGALNTRGPLTEKQQKLVQSLQPEFNDTKHEKGIVSMARGDDPASATTSLFIVTRLRRSDNKYSVFGRVLDGLEVVEKIDAAPVTGETPVTPITLLKVRVVPPQP